MQRVSIVAFFAAVTLCAGPRAWAQNRDPVAAEALFREGRAAADAGDYAAACPKFQASYRLEPTQGTLFNLADCEERSGQLSAAWQHFHQLLDQLPPTDDRRAYVQNHSAQIEPRVPRLRVVLAGAPQGTTVVRDGATLGDTLLGVSLPVDPGTHHIVVHAPDRADKAYDLTVAEREHRDLEVTVGAVLPRPVVVSVAPMPAPRPKSPMGRTLGFVIGGVGVASAAVGAVFGTLALADNGQSNASCLGGVCANQQAVDLHERAKTEALVADATIFAGVALVATGAVLLLTSRTSRRTEVRVAPAVSASGGGLMVAGSF